MKTTKRLLLILLAMLMLMSSVLVGCRKKDETGDEGDTSSVSTEESYETDEWGQRVYDTGIPDELDYGGEKVNILVTSKSFGDPRRYEWYVQTMDDTLTTEIYYRNEEIQEELGVELVFAEKGEGEEINNHITTNYGAGMGGVDIISNKHYNATATTLMTCYKNLMNEELTYLNLDHPYWNQNFIDAATAYDRLFVIVGDNNLSTYMTTFAVFFNKKLLSDWHNGMTPDELYQIALDGNWTIDKLIELCKDTYNKLDSEASEKSINDQYGFTSHSSSHAYDGFLAAFDMGLTLVDNEGNHTLNSDRANAELLGTAADKLATFYKTDDAFLVGKGSTDYVQPVANFKKGNSLFCVAGIGDCQHLTEMSAETTGAYGLLPMPKYKTTEEGQENYYGGVQDSHNSMAVMFHGAQNYEMISAVLELFASKSYSSVRPVLFERVVKGQYLNEAKDAQVFDIILAGTRWDFTDIYATAVVPEAGMSVRNVVWRKAIYDAVYKGSQDGAGVANGFANYKKTIGEQLVTLDTWMKDNG